MQAFVELVIFISWSVVVWIWVSLLVTLPVAELVIESISHKSAEAKWSPVQGVTTYTILLLNNGINVRNVSSKSPNITLEVLAPGTLYRLTVIANNEGGSSKGITTEFITGNGLTVLIFQISCIMFELIFFSFIYSWNCPVCFCNQKQFLIKMASIRRSFILHLCL